MTHIQTSSVPDQNLPKEKLANASIENQRFKILRGTIKRFGASKTNFQRSRV